MIDDPILTATEVAELACMRPRTIRWLVRIGAIPSVGRYGRDVLIRRSDYEDWRGRCEIPAKTDTRQT